MVSTAINHEKATEAKYFQTIFEQLYHRYAHTLIAYGHSNKQF